MMVISIVFPYFVVTIQRITSMNVKLSSTLFGMFFSLLCIGCGPSNPEGVVPVEGTLTYQGKSFEGLRMEFRPEFGRPSIAFTQAGGKFKAKFTDELNGVKPGKVKLYIVPQRKPAPGGAMIDDIPPGAEELVAKYGFKSAGYDMEITKADRRMQIDLQ